MKIQCLVGLIASGKSTYCKLAAKQGVIIVNDDAIVNMLHADNYTLYDKSLKLLYKSTENQIITTALAMGRNVVVDRGLNISQRGRKRWIAMSHGFDIPCEAIVFPRDTCAEHALRRTESDSRGHDYDYWYKVAIYHNSEYHLPTKEEGFSDVRFITWEEIQAGKVL